MLCIYADGQLQLVLELKGPAFTSVRLAYSNGSEKAQAQAEAEAWAGGLKEGVASSLGLASGTWFEGWISGSFCLVWTCFTWGCGCRSGGCELALMLSDDLFDDHCQRGTMTKSRRMGVAATESHPPLEILLLPNNVAIGACTR